jgi:hypothetical protein
MLQAAQLGGQYLPHCPCTAQLKHQVTQTHELPDCVLQTVASQVGTWVYVPS